MPIDICAPAYFVARIQFLRDIKTTFGTVFKVVEDQETDTLLLSCVGTGYTNVNKKTT